MLGAPYDFLPAGVSVAGSDEVQLTCSLVGVHQICPVTPPNLFVDPLMWRPHSSCSPFLNCCRRPRSRFSPRSLSPCPVAPCRTTTSCLQPRLPASASASRLYRLLASPYPLPLSSLALPERALELGFGSRDIYLHAIFRALPNRVMCRLPSRLVVSLTEVARHFFVSFLINCAC